LNQSFGVGTFYTTIRLKEKFDNKWDSHIWKGGLMR
jgi:hypothetical protein